VTPEELARERKAYLERRKKELEAPKRVTPAPDNTTQKRGLTRAERIKLLDDEFVPPKV
jgi:hypothetical protein